MDDKQLISLNWKFKEGFEESYIINSNYGDFESIHLPHNVKTIPYNYFSDCDMLGEYTYVKELKIGQEAEGKRIILEFEGVMTYFDLYVNGNKVGSHKGGYTKALMDITKEVKFGQVNTVVMMVDTNEREDIPPFGKVIDYMTYGGIYRDVHMHTVNNLYIENVLYKYEVSEDNKIIASPELIIHNHGKACRGAVEIEVKDSEDKVVSTHKCDFAIEEGKDTYKLESYELSDINLWDLETPFLYTVKIILSKNEEITDIHTVRTGFRKIAATAHGFYLNDRKVKIVGLNRHQSFPYVGYAMGNRAQRKDADILKDEIGLNTVRTSHYPQSVHFLDRCDEIGLLVFEEIPGWQYVSKENQEFRRVVLEDVKSMILTDFNHPSIFTWGVRLNESLDDDELYTKTNDLARELDSSRPTSGVRCVENSNLLEDIYTMNDFIHWGDEEVLRDQREITGLPYKVPYMVTEYGGHIYPTKKFDNEHRLIEHCKRHARVQSQMMLRDDIMGAIGWCAFDYNTHRDFGSGDKICYHGVMDMFRIPKFAAHVYGSQVDPAKKIVIEPATYFSRGEKNRGMVMPILIMTNCDYIELVIGDEVRGQFFPSGNYAGLKHAPVIIDIPHGDWGDRWRGGEFVGYIDGKRVGSKEYVADTYVADLKAVIDDRELLNTEVDTTRVTCTFVDQIGNLIPYYNGIIQVETEGDLEVIGPKTISVIGGSIAFWVKTKANLQEGSAKIMVKSLNTEIEDKVFHIKLI